MTLEEPSLKALLDELTALTGEEELEALTRALEERIAVVKREQAEEHPGSDVLFGY